MCLVSRERLFFLNQLLNLPNNGFYVLIPRKTLFLTKGFHERLIDHLEIGIFVLLDQVQDLAGIHLFILGKHVFMTFRQLLRIAFFSAASSGIALFGMLGCVEALTAGLISGRRA